VVTVETLPVKAAWRHLRDFLLETGHLVPIPPLRRAPPVHLHEGRPRRNTVRRAAWETMVPPVVTQTIKAKRLFGYAQAPERA